MKYEVLRTMLTCIAKTKWYCIISKKIKLLMSKGGKGHYYSINYCQQIKKYQCIVI